MVRHKGLKGPARKGLTRAEKLIRDAKRRGIPVQDTNLVNTKDEALNTIKKIFDGVNYEMFKLQKLIGGIFYLVINYYQNRERACRKPDPLRTIAEEYLFKKEKLNWLCRKAGLNQVP